MQADNYKDENVKHLKFLTVKLLNTKEMLEDFIEEVFNKDVFSMTVILILALTR